MPRSIRVLLIDDDAERRVRIAAPLSADSRIVVVLACGGVREAAEAEAGPLDVAIFADPLQNDDALQQWLPLSARHPQCGAVLVMAAPDVHRAVDAINAGFAECVSLDDQGMARLTPAVVRARDVARARQARLDSEARTTFLADLTSALSASLDLETLVEHLAQLVVPAIADFCSVNLVQPDGSVVQAAVRHADPAAAPALEELRLKYPRRDTPGTSLRHALETGEITLVERVTPGAISRISVNAEQEQLLAALHLTSIASVPLTARGRRLGAVLLARATPTRQFSRSDRSFLEDFGRRAAVAMDNARLYRDSLHDRQEIARLSQDLEQRINEIGTLLDVVPLGVAIAHDPECLDIRVNREFAKLLGITRDQNASLSAPPAERPPFRVEKDGAEVPVEDLPMQRAARLDVEVRDTELDVIHPDGRRVTLWEYASPLHDERGRVRGAVGAFLDISERKKLEEHQRLLVQAGVALASSLDIETTFERLCRLAVPALADWCAIHTLGSDGRLSGQAGVHVAPDVVLDLDRVAALLTPGDRGSGDTQPRWDGRRHVETAVDWSARAHGPADDDVAYLRAIGTESFLVVPVVSRGRVHGAVTLASARAGRFTAEDIWLVDELAARLGLALDNARLYEEAREANRLKDEFLANVSHELRTPLNAVIGWIRLLRTGSLGEATAARALEILERNTLAQAVLINDLLDVSRGASGTLRLSTADVDVNAICSAVADAIRPAAEARHLALSVTLDPAAPVIVADADRLRQVLWNLLSNSVKFTGEGGRVELSARGAPSGVAFVVRDTGAGIAPEFLPYVFDRFRQADTSTTRQHGGLGLGLSIVRDLVELHGGHVRAESAGIGRGSTFVVELPLKGPSAPVGADGVRMTTRA